MLPSVVWDLVQHLPRDAAVHVAIDPSLAWSPDMHLLAFIGDQLAIANWQRAGGKGRRPKPIRRPGSTSDVEVIRLDSFDSAAAFDEWRAAQLNM